MANRMRTYGLDLLILVALGAVFVLFYKPILHYGFTGVDDYDLIRFRWHEMKNWEEIPRSFVTDVFDKPGSVLYRPMQNISHILEAIGSSSDKPDSYLFHLTNLVLGCLNVLLLYLFLRQHNFSRTVSTASSALFIVHPLSIPVLAWIPGRADVMLVFFILVATILLRFYLQRRSILLLSLHLIFLLLALFTKDQSFLVVALYIVYLATIYPGMATSESDPPPRYTSYSFWIRTFQEKYHEHKALFISWGVCVVIWKVLHFIALYGQSPGVGFTLYELLTAYPELAAQLYFLVAPVNEAVFYNPNMEEIIGGSLALIALAWLVYASKTKPAYKAFALVWIIVWLVPTTLSGMVISHRLYIIIPVIPFLFNGWFARIRLTKTWRKTVIALLSTGYLFFLVSENYAFRVHFENELKYHQNAFTRNAHIKELSHWLAYFYHVTNELDSAQKYYEHTLYLDSLKPATRIGLAEIYNTRGFYEQADSLMIEETYVNNDSCLMVLYHAKFQAVRGNYDSAMVLAHQTLTLPDTTTLKDNWAEARALLDSLQQKTGGR